MFARSGELCVWCGVCVCGWSVVYGCVWYTDVCVCVCGWSVVCVCMGVCGELIQSMMWWQFNPQYQFNTHIYLFRARQK